MAHTSPSAWQPSHTSSQGHSALHGDSWVCAAIFKQNLLTAYHTTLTLFLPICYILIFSCGSYFSLYF